MQNLLWIVVPAALLFALVLVARGRQRRASVPPQPHGAVQAAPSAAGGGLQPVIDLTICMGSGGCVRACPERALGVVRGKAVLASAERCIGHGTCAGSCPVGAIKFVAQAA